MYAGIPLITGSGAFRKRRKGASYAVLPGCSGWSELNWTDTRLRAGVDFLGSRCANYWATCCRVAADGENVMQIRPRCSCLVE